MNLISRLRPACAAAIDAFSNSFNSANETGTRSPTSGLPLDTRKELSYFTRTQLIRKSRWCHNNLGLFRRFSKGTARYAVGCGISHIPSTRDEEWNQLSDDNFDNWASNEQLCDVRGRMSHWRQQKAVLHWLFRDGDVFALKTAMGQEARASGLFVPGLPQIQLAEAHTCSSEGNAYFGGDSDKEGFREGIRMNAFGRALEYKFLKDKDPRAMDLSAYRKVPADAVMHVLDDERASQVRGLPWMYHGMNSAIDIIDLVALEKVAVKLHSAMAAAIKKKTGEAGRGGFTGDLVKIRGANADGKKKVTTFENFAGGAGILQLDLDEEFQLFTSNRPSTTFSGFIDFLVRDMAWGFGVSPEFIWAVAGMGGPNSRVILEDAKWFFEEIQDLLVDLFVRKTYTWVTARSMARGELRECRDPRWWVCDFIGPSKITIDQGREGQLELDRLNAACSTWEEYWAARGKSGKKMVRKRIDELADAMKYAEEKDVPFEYVISMKPGTPGTGDDEEDPKPAPGRKVNGSDILRH